MACPTCGEDGEYYRGATALAELRHFTARIIWAAHRARQASDKLGLVARSALLSVLIDDLEKTQGAEEDTIPNDS